MIKIRECKNFRVPYYCENNKYISIEKNNRFIAVEYEKKRARKEVECISQELKEIIKSLFNNNIFKLISIETSSGCNNDCSFCPVNKYNNTRPLVLLEISLIEKIANELNKIDYCSVIALFGNNEPLMDRRLSEIISLFRVKCPKSYIKILTNGILITPEKTIELFKSGLSSLTINNYTDNFEFNQSTRELLLNSSELREYDIRIVIRDKFEKLTNRAGVLYKKKINIFKNVFCALPFVDLNISHNGSMKLCCFDAKGKSNYENIKNKSVVELWYNNRIEKIRESIMANNRRNLPLCSNCDFDGFRDPLQDWPLPLTREDLLVNI